MVRPSRLVPLALVLGLAAPVAAEPIELPVPHLYVSPAVGVWLWDDSALLEGEYDSGLGPMFGGRLGYAPLEALAVEVGVLTGTNRVTGADPGTEDLRLTQVEGSALVNFRGLALDRLHPYVALGAGYSFRDGDPRFAGEPVDDGGHVSFHLGIGFKMDLSARMGLRFQVRDTFYTLSGDDTGGGQRSDTVDSVEFGLGLDYRIPLSRHRSGDRLR
jgi:opacity protein-like surface antigen